MRSNLALLAVLLDVLLQTQLLQFDQLQDLLCIAAEFGAEGLHREHGVQDGCELVW
jgi:hypothetical protein